MDQIVRLGNPRLFPQPPPQHGLGCGEHKDSIIINNKRPQKRKNSVPQVAATKVIVVILYIIGGVAVIRVCLSSCLEA